MYKIVKNPLIALMAAIPLTIVGCSDEPSVDYQDITVPARKELTLSRAESQECKNLNLFSQGLLSKYIGLPENADLQTGNYLVSPLSASICLGMLANIGDDEYAESMAGLLKVEDLQSLNTAVKQLMEYLPSKNADGITALANSAWISQNLQCQETLRKCLNENYYASINSVAFTEPKTISIINSWCSDKTRGCIPEFLSSGDVSDLTKFILINALYYKCKWQYPFNEQATRAQTFHGTMGESQVQMMHTTEHLQYAAYTGCQAAWLPFKDGTQMAVFLPDEGISATDVLAQMAEKDLDALHSAAKSTQLTLDFPKFELSGEKYLDETLKTLGFSNSVIPEKLNTAEVCNLKVKQKLVFAVDEHGGKIAVVTGVVGETSSGWSEPEIRLTFDRPFAFIIYDPETGCILLGGVINNL